MLRLREQIFPGLCRARISASLSGKRSYFDFVQVYKYEEMPDNLTTPLRGDDRRGRSLVIYIGLTPTDEPIERVSNHPDFVAVNRLVEQDLVADAKSQAFFVDDWTGAVTLPDYPQRRPLYPRAFRTCRLLSAGLLVYSNGKVGPCAWRDFEAPSELILGNVSTESRASMWPGDTLARPRHDGLTRNRVPDICRCCRHYLY